MSNIILRGGLMFINNSSMAYKPINIALLKSPVWLSGIISINNLPYFRVLPHRDNYIEIKTVNEKNYLLVNDRDIYRSYDIFHYTINVKLHEQMRHRSYGEFFKYY
jgi:hypothetical protein